MWLHPLTATHISTLRSFGYEEIPVVDRVQVCGDKGWYKTITVTVAFHFYALLLLCIVGDLSYQTPILCCHAPMWGQGTPLFPLVHLLPHLFPFLSLALLIFFYRPSLPFLPE